MSRRKLKLRKGRVIKILVAITVIVLFATGRIQISYPKKDKSAVVVIGTAEMDLVNTEVITTTSEISPVVEQDTTKIDTINTDESFYSSKLNRWVTETELYNLTMITYSESGNQSYQGKVAVAATVLNRMISSLFPNSMESIIFNGEFSSAEGNRFFSGAEHTEENELTRANVYPYIFEEAEMAAKAALNGEDPTQEVLGEGALFFYNPLYTEESEILLRDEITKTVLIGDHIFYSNWDDPDYLSINQW